MVEWQGEEFLLYVDYIVVIANVLLLFPFTLFSLGFFLGFRAGTRWKEILVMYESIDRLHRLLFKQATNIEHRVFTYSSSIDDPKCDLKL